MEQWQGGEGACCRLMIGMQDKPEDELRKVFSLRSQQEIDQATVAKLKTRVAQDFRNQLQIGAPTNKDQERCSTQIVLSQPSMNSTCHAMVLPTTSLRNRRP
jgi:hypothetical protein